MNRFRYRAYTKAGIIETGDVEAETREAAIRQLIARGLHPVEARPAAGSAGQRWWEIEVWPSANVKTRALSAFTRALATLLSADVPVDTALRLSFDDHKRSAADRFAHDTLARVTAGAHLSDALEAAAGGRLPPYYAGLVRAGEASGNLRGVLTELADLMERHHEMKSRLGSALVYPMILVVLAIVAVAFVVTVLVPTVAPLLETAGAELPTLLRGLQLLSGIVAVHWPWLVLVALCGIVILKTAWRRPSVRRTRDRFLLWLPVAGPLVAKLQTARLARVLATLLRGGVPLVTALALSAKTTSNSVLQLEIEAAAQDLHTGSTLREALTAVTTLPPLAVRLISVGEESGKLEEMLAHIARMFDTEAERGVERLMTILTPALTILLGLGIGGLLLTVMKAIMRINDVVLQ